MPCSRARYVGTSPEDSDMKKATARRGQRIGDASVTHRCLLCASSPCRPHRPTPRVCGPSTRTTSFARRGAEAVAAVRAARAARRFLRVLALRRLGTAAGPARSSCRLPLSDAARPGDERGRVSFRYGRRAAHPHNAHRPSAVACRRRTRAQRRRHSHAQPIHRGRRRSRIDPHARAARAGGRRQDQPGRGAARGRRRDRHAGHARARHHGERLRRPRAAHAALAQRQRPPLRRIAARGSTSSTRRARPTSSARACRRSRRWRRRRSSSAPRPGSSRWRCA